MPPKGFDKCNITCYKIAMDDISYLPKKSRAATALPAVWNMRAAKPAAHETIASEVRQAFGRQKRNGWWITWSSHQLFQIDFKKAVIDSARENAPLLQLSKLVWDTANLNRFIYYAQLSRGKIDGQKRLGAVSGLIWDDYLVGARARSQIWRSVRNALGEELDRDGEIDINQLDLDRARAVLDKALRKHTSFCLGVRYAIGLDAIPSTQCWVHGFMLWTGISPPVARISGPDRRFALSSQLSTGGGNVPHRRPNPGRNHGRPFLWRTATRNRLRDIQARQSFVLCPLDGRRQRLHSLCAASGRPFPGASRKQVGGELPVSGRARANRFQIGKTG